MGNPRQQVLEQSVPSPSCLSNKNISKESDQRNAH